MTHAAATILLASLAATASRASILMPTSAYLNSTRPVAFVDRNEAPLTSISDSFLTIAFSSPMRAVAPLKAESSNPRVLRSGWDADFKPVTAVTFFLSQPLSVFGFLAEPLNTDKRTLTVTFFMGGQLVETISRDVNKGSALLFAAAAQPGIFFDSVTLTSDADWAMGQIRYAPFRQTEPERRPWGFVPAGLVLLLGITRKLLTIK